MKMDDLGGKPTIFGNPHLEVLEGFEDCEALLYFIDR